MSLQEKSQFIKQQALEIGFDACGIAKAEYLSDDASHLQSWLNAGFHAGMHYMKNHFEKRTDPVKLIEGAKSIIVVLLNYYPKNYPFTGKPFKIARYALGEDYHFVIKKKLNFLFEKLNEKFGPVNGRAFTDSAPIMERAWAREAGLGWMGKNSLLLNKNLGSYFFIAELIIDCELEYDQQKQIPNCGTCNRCIKACPTKAIVSPGIIDSNKCISYHAIESKDVIPDEIKLNQNGWVFGCDICQEVCPWNGMSIPNNTDEFNPTASILSFSKEEIDAMNEDEFSIQFKGSPLKRAGLKGLQKNMKNLH
jgi:epoxyqueuosine reductase